MTKQLMPESKEYWIKRGMSDVDAEKESIRRKGGRCKWNKNYYILRGFPEEDAIRMAEEAKSTCPVTKTNRLEKFGGDEERYKEWILDNCNLSKKNMLKTMTLDEYEIEKRRLGNKLIGNRPSDVSYWVDKGFSEEVAKLKIIEAARKSSKRCPEYWVAKGYTESAAIMKVSEHQNNNSIDRFIERYGADVGALKYNNLVELRKEQSKRSILYWKLIGFSEEDSIDKVREYQSQLGKKSPSGVLYWTDMGFSEEDANVERKNWIASNFENCTQYWTDKGFSEEDASKLQKQVQSDRGKLGALKQRYGHKSSLEVEFDKLTRDVQNKIWTSSVKRTNGSYYFPDFEFNKCFVEIHGDYWHGNPSIHGPNSKLCYGKSAKEKWEADAIRSEEITKITGKPVIVIWEEEFNNGTVKDRIKNEISKYY